MLTSPRPDKTEAPSNPFADAALIYQWYPIDKLEPGFVRFLFADLAEYPSASKVFDGKVYVHRELVHKHSSYDVDWSTSASGQP